MLEELSFDQWQEFESEGYLRLGRCLSDDELAAMQRRMDEIMLGTAPVDYSRMMMQLDLFRLRPADYDLDGARPGDRCQRLCVHRAAALLHNYLPHSSGVNRTSVARRAFSVCYMDAATVDSHNHEYSLIFGDGALDPERL